ncbi:MAG: malonyl-CoA decarboxylase family protein [Pseudomonadota bacterium]
MAEAEQRQSPTIIGRFLGGVLRLTEGRLTAAKTDDDILEEMRGHLDLAVDPQSAELSARAHATAVGRLYLSSRTAVRRGLMHLLLTDYGVERTTITEAARTFLEDPERADLNVLRDAVTPRRIAFLSRLTSVEGGIKFLVDLRASVLDAAASDKTLRPLSDDIQRLLLIWFDLGLLEMRRITWESPASLLEKLIAYEAVHEMRSWDDLKGRLGAGRRLYALFHPNISDEPLIFVQVAFTKGMAPSVDRLIEKSEPMGEKGFDTAIFYSISNTQPGLAGIPFGEYLIKQVVDDIRTSEPRVLNFATLSPIPGLRRWLKDQLPEDTPELDAASDTTSETALMAQAARYLTTYDPDRRRALDPVGHFHLSNGARVERVNWAADRSERGRAQSFGIMVNYAYDLDKLDKRKTGYALDGNISAERMVRDLAKQAG